MKTNKQLGFNPVEIILAVVVVLGVAGLVTWRVLDSKKDGNNNASQAQNTGSPENAEQLSLEQQQAQEAAQLGGGTQGGAAGQGTSGGGGSLSAPGPSPQNTGGNTGSPTNGGSQNTTVTPPPPVTSDSGDTPQVTLTYPSFWGQTVSGVITMTATASDSSGIQKVVFMIRRIGYAQPVYTQEDTTSPYSAQFDTRTLPNGGSEYTVEAQAFDNKGTGNLASHRINIQN